MAYRPLPRPTAQLIATHAHCGQMQRDDLPRSIPTQYANCNMTRQIYPAKRGAFEN
jgi:hypothetical protein